MTPTDNKTNPNTTSLLSYRCPRQPHLLLTNTKTCTTRRTRPNRYPGCQDCPGPTKLTTPIEVRDWTPPPLPLPPPSSLTHAPFGLPPGTLILGGILQDLWHKYTALDPRTNPRARYVTAAQITNIVGILGTRGAIPGWDLDETKEQESGGV